MNYFVGKHRIFRRHSFALDGTKNNLFDCRHFREVLQPWQYHRFRKGIRSWPISEIQYIHDRVARRTRWNSERADVGMASRNEMIGLRLYRKHPLIYMIAFRH